MPHRSSPWFDLVTFILLAASVVILGGSFLIVANPQVPFNPLPPATLPALLAIPSSTPTASPSPSPSVTLTPSITPTYTPSGTFTPSPSATLTFTPSPSYTPSPTVTLTPSFTPVLPGLASFTPAALVTASPVSLESGGEVVQPGIVIPTGAGLPLDLGGASPYPFVGEGLAYRANTNPQACDWLSIAGEVLGLLGEPLLNLAVEVAGEGFSEVQFSGTAPTFGAGGFEVNLGNRPAARAFSVRLLGPLGEPLSDYILIETGATCADNVALINLRQVRAIE